MARCHLGPRCDRIWPIRLSSLTSRLDDLVSPHGICFFPLHRLRRPTGTEDAAASRRWTVTAQGFSAATTNAASDNSPGPETAARNGDPLDDGTSHLTMKTKLRSHHPLRPSVSPDPTTACPCWQDVPFILVAALAFDGIDKSPAWPPGRWAQHAWRERETNTKDEGRARDLLMTKGHRCHQWRGCLLPTERWLALTTKGSFHLPFRMMPRFCNAYIILLLPLAS